MQLITQRWEYTKPKDSQQTVQLQVQWSINRVNSSLCI